jgi:hypothetical protein
MKAERVAIVAALIGGVGWVSKMIIMAARGGPDLEYIPESIAFFAGLLGTTIAAGAVAWMLAASLPTLLRVLAAILGAILPLAIVGVFQLVAGEAMPDAGWFLDEAVFLILGVIALSFAAWRALRGGLSPSR